MFDDSALSVVNLSDHSATAITLTPPVFYNAPNKRDNTNNHLLWCKASTVQIVEYQARLTEETELLLHNFPVVMLDCPDCLSSEQTSLIDSLCCQLFVIVGVHVFRTVGLQHQSPL